MATTPLPIAGGFYESDSLPISAQECTNWFPNLPQTAALSQETLFGTPGKSLLAPGEGVREANRGADVLAGIPYFVNGNVLYRLNRTVTDMLETFDVTALGTIEGTGRVSMANNGTQICIMVPGGKGYIFVTAPDTLTEITDLDFRANGNPQSVVFVDGYFAFNTDTKKFIISALNDGLAYNALDFSSAESDPDIISALVVYNNQLFVAGSETTEAQQNIGGADFPFQRTGLFSDIGVDAPFSVVKTTGAFMFIGSGKNGSASIWEWRGNAPRKISTTAIDSLLQKFTVEEIEAAFAWSYAQKGGFFVGFTLPTTTLVYDTITERWHERKSQIVDFKGTTQTVRDRINSVVSAYGRVLVGDSQDGRIGSLDPSVFKEYGADIIRPVATQPFQNNMRAFSVASLELTVESGVGNADVPDPKVRLEISRDGGKTYGHSRTRRLGKIGEYEHRAIWWKLGRIPRFAIFRFTVSDAVKPVIIQLTADIVST